MFHWSNTRCFMFLFSNLTLLAVFSYLMLFVLPKDNNSGPRASPTLQLLVVISRFGNRRPINSFPNDPYTLWNWHYNVGELTNCGRIQMYNLGSNIRTLYNGFLSTTYSAHEISATSIDKDNTLMSGEVFLAGLFPPVGFQIWNKGILWQPIPLYSTSLNNPDLILNDCPRLQQELNISVTKYLKQNAAVIKPLVDYLKNFTRSNNTGTNLLFKVWDTILSEETEGLALPNWIKKVYPQPMDELISKMFIAYYSGTDTMIKLIIGRYFRRVIELIIKKANKTLKPDRKVYYYSENDITLVSMQALLGIPKSLIIANVKPSSAIILELHQDLVTKAFSVEIIFIDGSNLQPTPIIIPDCNSPCDLNQLVKITSKFWNFTDYKKQCHKLDTNFN